MATASFRFYEELNDFLQPSQRRVEFTLRFDPPAPVRHLIELLGVPHTEVEIILVNGISVDLEQTVSDGDRVSVYPMFEALDVEELLRLRPEPLREPRFLADAHLGRLAAYLRMLGFDTLYHNAWPDERIAALARDERRVLLSRDRALLMRKSVTHGCYIRRDAPWRQLTRLVRRLDLCGKIKPFTRCMRCNGTLQQVARKEVEAGLPEGVRRSAGWFLRCRECRKVYWDGSHYRRMGQRIAELCPRSARRVGLDFGGPALPPDRFG